MDRVYTKNDRILRKDLAEGPVLIDPYRRTMIPLDPVGEEIWRLIDGKRSVVEIAEAIRALWDAGSEPVEKDVAAFLEGLAAREIVT